MKIAKIAAFLLLALTLLSLPAFAVSVEQTQICMPKIDLYVYEDGNDLSQVNQKEITASLDGAPLQVRGLSRSEQGVFYVYMLDVSASIPQGHFSAAKEALLEARSRLREQDRLALITFGNEVTVLLQGGESRQTLEQALEQLENKDHNTMFYNAMDALVEMMLQTQDMRRVAVVISDGLDDTEAGMTQTELEEKLIRSGVSVSAMCIDTVSNQKAENFADFIRLSGGELYLFGASDAQSVMQSLLSRLDGGWHLELEAANNIASGRDSLLKVDFGTAAHLEFLVIPESWTPDDSPPYVKDFIYQTESNSFLVSYSEPVLGADDLKAYVLVDENNTQLEISGVEAVDEVSIRLLLAQKLNDGAKISISAKDVHDISMEANPLMETAHLIWTSAPATDAVNEAPGAEPSNEPTASAPLIGYGTIIFMGAVLVLIGVSVAVIYKLSESKQGTKKAKTKKKQKTKPQEDESIARFVFIADDSENTR